MNPISVVSPQTIMRLNELTQSGVTDLAEAGQPRQTFKELLIESIDQVNTMQQDADVAVETLLTGGDINPSEVLASVQKADMSFRMMQQIRNKLVEAYQEIKDIRI